MQCPRCHKECLERDLVPWKRYKCSGRCRFVNYERVANLSVGEMELDRALKDIAKKGSAEIDLFTIQHVIFPSNPGKSSWSQLQDWVILHELGSIRGEEKKTTGRVVREYVELTRLF